MLPYLREYLIWCQKISEFTSLCTQSLCPLGLCKVARGTLFCGETEKLPPLDYRCSCWRSCSCSQTSSASLRASTTPSYLLLLLYCSPRLMDTSITRNPSWPDPSTEICCYAATPASHQDPHRTRAFQCTD